MYNKGKCSSLTYIRTENPVFRWGFLKNAIPMAVARFQNMKRLGNPQADWASSSSWGSPLVAIAPPQKGVQYNG